MLPNKKLHLSKHVIKRFEPDLNLYFFYNAKSQKFWECNKIQGDVVASLDGNYTLKEILDIIYSNNTGLDYEKLSYLFSETFKFLVTEGFVYVAD